MKKLKKRIPGNRVILNPDERRRLMKIGAEVDHRIEDNSPTALAWFDLLTTPIQSSSIEQIFMPAGFLGGFQPSSTFWATAVGARGPRQASIYLLVNF
ncbi:MAG: hypothetical protein JXA11_12605 [Phycisphaerae bacterium]|nr:hypothetical protein [Phycisphaerae bacterium]